MTSTNETRKLTWSNVGSWLRLFGGNHSDRNTTKSETLSYGCTHGTRKKKIKKELKGPVLIIIITIRRRRRWGKVKLVVIKAKRALPNQKGSLDHRLILQKKTLATTGLYPELDIFLLLILLYPASNQYKFKYRLCRIVFESLNDEYLTIAPFFPFHLKRHTTDIIGFCFCFFIWVIVIS